MTLPEVSDHRFHRSDIFKEKMTQADPVGPVIEEMLRTLKRGDRIWWVGKLMLLRQGETPEEIAPAPHSRYGWDEHAYQKNWSRQAAYALQVHGQTLRLFRVHAEGPVSRFEDVPLLMAEGWRS